MAKYLALSDQGIKQGIESQYYYVKIRALKVTILKYSQEMTMATINYLEKINMASITFVLKDKCSGYLFLE